MKNLKIVNSSMGVGGQDSRPSIIYASSRATYMLENTSPHPTRLIRVFWPDLNSLTLDPGTSHSGASFLGRSQSQSRFSVRGVDHCNRMSPVSRYIPVIIYVGPSGAVTSYTLTPARNHGYLSSLSAGVISSITPHLGPCSYIDSYSYHKSHIESQLALSLTGKVSANLKPLHYRF